jgi:hypothetical protein
MEARQQLEEINMSEKPGDVAESDKETVSEVEIEDDGLVEVGAVSGTQGGFFGFAGDTGGAGWRMG